MSEPERPKPSVSESDELSGHVGKYEIIQRLGRGAMGVVYHARDPMLERDVALKVMLSQIADDPEQKARFEREARAVARMMHPNVVAVFDLGYHDGSPYIAMELLQGQDLLHAMREGPAMTLDQNVTIVLQVLEGLAHAHRVGIVHRDIKPANIFLNSDGVAKIMDFGVARFTAASMTATGVVLGTANYMSPEQVEGEKVDGRSDLFSLGCMLYELVAGQRPFQADSLMTTLYRITHHEPKYELPPGAEYETLTPILKKALAKRAEERYQTAAEFASALREFLKNVAVPGSVAAAITPGATPPAAGPAAAPKTGSAPAAAPSSIEDLLTTTSRRRADPTALYRLMTDIYTGSKSGHLHFSHGAERRSLRILRGQVIQSTSDVAGEHLGDVLVRYGLLSQPDLERATTILLRDRKRLGVVLSELGIMDKPRLEESVGLHVREILFNVAGRADGTYFFEEMSADMVEEGDLSSKISMGELILESAKRLQDPELTQRVLGDTSRLLALSSQPLLRSQKITLTPTDGFVLSRVDGTMSAGEVINLVPLPPEDTERSLFSLLCTGMIEYVERPATARQPSADSRSGTRPEAARQAASPPRQEAPAPARETPAVQRPEPPPPPRPPATAPPRHEAPTVRKESVAPAASSSRSVPARPAPSSKPAPAPAPTPEDRRQQILEAYEGLSAKTHFEVLGIPKASNEAQVKDAYFRLARVFHPDAQKDPAMADLADKSRAVFIRLGEAYATLMDAGRRSSYEADLAARLSRFRPEVPVAPSPLSPGLEAGGLAAVESAQAAERLFQEGKFWEAIQLLERALPRLEGKTKIKASVTLAKAYLKNPKWMKRAEELLRRLVETTPDAEAFFLLGTIYRMNQINARAQAMFRKALEIHPGHKEAMTELAAMGATPPEEAPPPADRPGLLKKLFKKS